MSFVPLWIEWSLLAGAGIVAGALNVVAGGGSFLILPLLLFLGLPAAVANGTNRVGVFVQNLGGLTGFHRHGAVDWPWAIRVSVPALVGSALGSWAALAIPDFAFRRVLSILMILITLASFFSPKRTQVELRSPWHPAVLAGFFIVGIYGGFIQAGVGFVVLAITTYAGMDLVRGNAVKLLSILLLTTLSLAVFAAASSVDWPKGIALAVGNLIGSQIGVRMAVLKGQAWLQKVVTATIILFAIALWFQ